MDPKLFGTRNWFNGRQFFHKLEWGAWFQDDSSLLHLLCSLFLLLLHQLHLRSSGIRSQRLETPTLKQCLPSSWMWFLFSIKKKKTKQNMKVTQSCPTLFNPTDYTYISLILSLHSSKLSFLCLISYFFHYL